MEERAIRRTLARCSILILAATLAAFPAVARAKVVVVTTTIQAAVDAADPGDTVAVPAGVYHESVLVDKDNLTIQGSPAAVIDASGFDEGIHVGTGSISEDIPPVCPPLEIQGFKIVGLTIRNADENGIFLIGVDGFRITGGTYLGNREYGIFPRCSQNGLIDLNAVDAQGVADDAGIYVGVDDNVTVTGNSVTGGPIGIEIENTINTVVQGNKATGNTSGILVVVLPGLPRASTENILIEGNVVSKNNFPNPLPPGTPDDVALIPTGTGILNVGGDKVVIRGNSITGNNTTGVALFDDPFAEFDPRIDPLVNLNEVRNNVILQNGKAPDPDRSLAPGADITYLSNSTDNCFAGNVFKVDFPAGIVSALPCP